MDPGLVFRDYKSELERRQALWEAHMPKICPRDGNALTWLAGDISGRMYRVRCTKKNCGFSSSILNGTPFKHGKHTLGTWYEVIKMIAANPKTRYGVIANTIGVQKRWVQEVYKPIVEWLYTWGYVKEKDLRPVRRKVQG